MTSQAMVKLADELPTKSAMETALRYVQRQARQLKDLVRTVSGAGEGEEIYNDAAKCIEFAIHRLAAAPAASPQFDVSGLSETAIEDIRAHIRGKQDGPDTYDYELGSGWRCFHCGEMFRTWGGAALHFGKPTDPKPVCATPAASGGVRTFIGTDNKALVQRLLHGSDDHETSMLLRQEAAQALTAPPLPADGVRENVARECDWPVERYFKFHDEPGAHDPCYVVMPDGAMLPLNHHAGEGVDIARAKFIVVACNAALKAGFPLSPAQIQLIVTEAMQDTWNDICSDTDCHPLDIEQLGSRRLGFHVGHWARQTGARVAAALTAPPLPADGVRCPQLWNEVRDFFQDIVGGDRITENSVEHAKQFVFEIDAILAALASPHEQGEG